MTRSSRLIVPAFVFFLFGNPLIAASDEPAGSVESEGTSKLVFPADRLKMEAKIIATGQTIEEAMKSLESQRSALKAAILESGADPASLKFGRPEQDELLQRGVRIARSLIKLSEEASEPAEGGDGANSDQPAASEAKPSHLLEFIDAGLESLVGMAFGGVGLPGQINVPMAGTTTITPIPAPNYAPTIKGEKEGDAVVPPTDAPTRTEPDVANSSIQPAPSVQVGTPPVAAEVPTKTKDPAVKKNSLESDASKPKPAATHIKDDDDKPETPAPRFVVCETVSAQWPLDADGDKAIAKGASIREMIEAKNITGFDKMVDAFIPGGGEEYLEILQEAPESKVVIDEIKHYFALDFKYIHKLTAEEREMVVTEAFDKAKEQASLLARAAGNRLGGVQSMRLIDPGDEGFSFWKWILCKGARTSP